MLARMQQELNSRFLHDRSLLPLGLPSMPFTLHTEMHQHQHLHHHQHVVTPGFLPPPSAAGLFATPMAMVGSYQIFFSSCSALAISTLVVLFWLFVLECRVVIILPYRDHLQLYYMPNCRRTSCWFCLIKSNTYETGITEHYGPSCVYLNSSHYTLRHHQQL